MSKNFDDTEHNPRTSKTGPDRTPAAEQKAALGHLVDSLDAEFGPADPATVEELRTVFSPESGAPAKRIEPALLDYLNSRHDLSWDDEVAGLRIRKGRRSMLVREQGAAIELVTDANIDRQVQAEYRDDTFLALLAEVVEVLIDADWGDRGIVSKNWTLGMLVNRELRAAAARAR